MMCAFEAMAIRAENIEKEEIEKELKRIEFEQKTTKVSQALCEEVIAPLLEKLAQNIYRKDWGQITIEVWDNNPNSRGYLVDTTTKDYVDHRTSYLITNYYYSEDNYPLFDLKKVREYLNSYCWDFDIEFFEGYMYGRGLVKLAKIKFKPMPSCL